MARIAPHDTIGSGCDDVIKWESVQVSNGTRLSQSGQLPTFECLCHACCVKMINNGRATPGCSSSWTSDAPSKRGAVVDPWYGRI